MELSFGVIGGDQRQRCLAELLQQDGHRVSAWGLPEGGKVPVTGLEKVLTAEVVLLPLPVTGPGGVLNAPFARREIRIPELLDSLSSQQIICAGQVPESVPQSAGRRGLVLEDYFAREELAVGNAVPTAEGAIAIAMERLPETLAGQRCLVLGFGRIGKLLARRLQGLGARVTASARKPEDLAWIRACGYDALPIKNLTGALGEYRLIFNTAPALLLDRELLGQLRADCLCIDLASSPGGIDYEAAEQLQIQTVWARNLPGKAAPLTAGMIIRDTIYHILEERGVWQ